MTTPRESVTEVAPGIYRVHRASVNCYLVVEQDGIILVDGGLPGMWRTLFSALGAVGAVPGDISTVILTHGHFDHVGLCARLRRDHGVGAHIHDDDRRLARHPYRYRHEAARWIYPFRYPGSLPVAAQLVAAGALNVKGDDVAGAVRPGVALDAPGGPIPVWSPGHTDGHCGFLLPRSGVLFTGDALVTLDPYSGRVGPRIVARAATADSSRNRESLEALAATEAAVLLPGHGDPFIGSARHAVDIARAESVA